MWLKTQGGKLVNLDNTARVFIADKKITKWSSNFESYPAVYAQFSDGNSEAFDSVLFEAEYYKAYEQKASWQITDEDRKEILKRGREECQLYIDTLFFFFSRRHNVSHDEILDEMEGQIKKGKHPNLSTPEEEKADAA